MFRILLLSLACIGLIACDTEPVDPDPTPSELPKLSISSLTFFEGDVETTKPFRITTSAAHTEAIQVDYTTQEETAGENIDYIPVSGTLTIPAGEREAVINVTIVADTFRENDETFKLVLSKPVQATLTEAEATATIRNDDDFVFVPADGYITPESYVGYNLVWQDEFDGPEIDLNNWTHEMGAGGWGNEESQHYTDRPDNSYISDGALIIEAKREDYQGAPYTSARMITAGKKTFTFGRVDIRATLPEGQGIWPALWMLGSNISSVGWPACGEIDIMELVGHEPGTVHGTAHWGPQGQTFSFFKGTGYSLGGGEKFSDEFHVFSIEWEPDVLRWYVDDNPYFTITPSDVNGAYPFNQEFFFIFNIAVGGRWPGYPDGTTVFPQKMKVDYIRMFQKK